MSICPAAARLGANQLEAGANELGFFLLSIDMGGARLGREPAIGPALHLRYWPIQIEKNFFIFTLPACALGRTKLAWANLDDSN